MGPVRHINRRFLPVNTAISHFDEPNAFQVNDPDEYTSYRSQFARKIFHQGFEPRRVSSPTRRNRPHPTEVRHLKRIRSFVCDVRSKLPANASERNILGISRNSSRSDPTTWTRKVYTTYDRKMYKSTVRRRCPAMGIVPGCMSRSELKDTRINGPANKDHWLPGK